MKLVVVVGALALGCAAKPTPVPVVVMPPPTPLVAMAPPKALAIAQPALVQNALPNDPSHTTVHRLSNGMTVYLSPDRQLPTIVARITVKSGAANDPKDSTGLAHYLEHMLFKGSQQLGTIDYAQEKPHLDKIAALYKQLREPGADVDPIFAEIDAETQRAAAFEVPGEYSNLYTRIGVSDHNAFTNLDYTEYIATIPKNRVAQWARVEADRFTSPVFRAFWTELEAVYEEKNRSFDNDQRRIFEAEMAALYPDHGYGQRVLGESEHLKKPAYADMLADYARYYTPQNMAIELSGDVDASVLPILDAAFAGFKPPPGAAHEARPIAPLTGRTEVAVPVASGEGVMLAWRTVKATDPDRDPLAVMDLLLLDNESAGLVQRELLQDQRVAEANASPTFLREAGHYTMSAEALAGQTPEQLEQLLLGVVKKLQDGAFTDEDLKTAILGAEIDHQLALETNAGREERMEHAFVVGEEWTHAVGELDRMRAVTRADVMRVAKQYLGTNYVVVKRVKGPWSAPRIAKPKITPIAAVAGRESAFAKAIEAMPVVPIEPVSLVAGKDYVHTGSTIVVPNTRNQLFSSTFEYEFGRREDRLACYALALLPHAGAGKKSASDVFRELHALGLEIATSCDKDHSSITLSGVDRNLDAGMALLRAQLAEPTLDAATVAAALAAATTARTNEMELGTSIAIAQDHFTRYGAESDRLVVATTKQLAAAKPAQLAKIIHGYLALQHRTAYFGPRAAPQIALGDGSHQTGHVIPKLRDKSIVLAKNLDMAQTIIWMIWPRASTDSTQRALGSIFDGYASSLIYDEVRESRGLAYTAYGGYEASPWAPDPSYLYAYAATQGDKVHDAIDAMLGALAMPVDETRFRTAKDQLAQSYRVSRLTPRAIAAQVFAWQDEFEEADTDPRAVRAAEVAKVERPAFQAWLAGALKGTRLISIAGDSQYFDDAKLEALGPMRRTTTHELFGY